MSLEPFSVLIVDDHPVFRKGLRTLLSAMPALALSGEASNAADAVRLAEELQPDSVLMDLQMPDHSGNTGGGSSGLAAIRQIVTTSPHIRVLVDTMFEDNDSVFAAMRAGARGYILKDMEDEGMAQGVSNDAIAQRLSFSSKTVRNYVSNIFSKLQVADRAQAIVKAREAGLG